MKEEPQLTILVVEDDEVCSRLAVRQLTHLGFAAHTCANGKEALEQLSRGSYSLILMDLQMPVMGGIEATRAIRQLEQKTQQHIPIIAVTANPDRDLCLKAGVDDFIFKPPSLGVLSEVLNRWLPITRHTEKHQPAVQSANRPLVLVVETDPSTRQLLAYFLEEASYTVEFADDGYIALDRVRLVQPALLITEVHLPHLDGFALCRLLKQDTVTRGIPILVFSRLDAEERARESGADAFMKKPLEKRRLLQALDSLILSKSLPPEAA